MKNILLLFLVIVLGFSTCDKKDGTSTIIVPPTDSEYNGFEIKGRLLYSPDDEKVILIGPNLMSTWIDKPGNSFSEISQTPRS